MPLTGAEQAALDEFCRQVRGRFGARLRDLALFGSRARGEGHEDSDLDVLVVVDGLSSDEAREVAYVAGDMMTEHAVLLSPFVVSREHMQRLVDNERMIVTEIARDRISL